MILLDPKSEKIRSDRIGFGLVSDRICTPLSGTTMANTALVSCNHDHASTKTLSVAEKPSPALSETSAKNAASSSQETTAPSLSLVWKSLKLQGISDKAARIIINSWRVGTKRQYQTSLKKWEEFCGKQQIDPVRPTLTMILDFLTELYEQGQQYSSLNTARSALSSVIALSGEVPAGRHPLVCRFLKGVFQERPALPRYVDTWDVSLVLNYIKDQYPLEKLGLKELTLKLVVLISLLSGQRTQTLQELCMKDIILTDSDCTMHITILPLNTQGLESIKRLLGCQCITTAGCAWFIHYAAT